MADQSSISSSPKAQSQSVVSRRKLLNSRPARISLALALLLVLTYCLRPPPRDVKEGVVWLNCAEAAKRPQAGTFTRLKFRFLMASPRIWNWYASRQKQMLLTLRFLTVASDSSLPPQLAAQSFTNSDGMRAWILSDQEFAALAQWTNASTVTVLRMTTMEGMDASMSSGNAAAANASMSISPKVSRKHFDLQLNALYTTPGNSAGVTPAPQLTNFAAACRAALPNGGAIVLDGGKRSDSQGTNYWLSISCVAVDSKGNPKKL
jgi:hypothetical protein